MFRIVGFVDEGLAPSSHLIDHNEDELVEQLLRGFGWLTKPDRRPIFVLGDDQDRAGVDLEVGP